MASEDQNVKFFNEERNTSYTKDEIAGIYWICDIYKLKTIDGISYAHNCHTCGKKLDTVGNEYCGPDCKLIHDFRDHNPQYQCFWGKECKMCNKAYKKNESNYSDYEEEENYDDLEYSDDIIENENEEDELLLSLKLPETDIYSKPALERGSNYISSDEDDVLLMTLPINNIHLSQNQEHIFDIMNSLFSQKK